MLLFRIFIHFGNNFFSEKGAYVIGLALSSTLAGGDHNIKALWEKLFIFTVSLPDNTPCTAAADSISYFFTGRNAQTVYFSSVFSEINNAVLTCAESALAVQTYKILILIDPYSIFHKITCT